ncbi:protein kinase [Candidatus Pacearchaeota archaeon]|nr:protein kinase [Candidatus Pacearchaeota archaeon]
MGKDIMMLGKADVEGLTSDELEELEARGYTIFEKLGEGVTRDVYLAAYRSGNVHRTRVIKLPKTELGTFMSRANRGRRDQDLNEVCLSNRIHHPNVVEIVDSFPLGRRTVNIEPHINGTDLETLVSQTGAITDAERFDRIMTQILDGAVYLEELDLLHRDYKPSNILMTDKGDVKISDLQTAAFFTDVSDSTLPTRGGTPYTHPSLFFSLLTRVPSRASPKTEVYSLGTTMLHLLTGKRPFDYRIVEDSDGTPIEFNGETYRIKVFSGERELNPRQFDVKEHNDRLKSELRKIPKKYRGLLYDAISLAPNIAIRKVSDLRERFRETKSPEFLNSLRTGLRFIPATIATVGLIAGAFMYSYYHPREETPTVAEITDRDTYSRFSLEDIAEQSDLNQAAINVLFEPYLEDAKKRLPELEPDIERYIGLHYKDYELLGKRITNSLLRACYLHHEEALSHYQSEGEKRAAPVFSPKDIDLARKIKHNLPGYYQDPPEPAEALFSGALYLKQLMEPGRNIADVFAHYFSSDLEIAAAKISTGSTHYLPYDFENHLRKGYQQRLPPVERDLINTAIALYLITDDNGDIDWNRAPEISPFDESRVKRLFYGD